MTKKLTKKQKEEIIKKYGRIPTEKEVFEKIKESQERLVAALAGAWETAPDDPEIKKDILKAMEKAVKLREKVYKQVIKEEPPDIRKSYEKLKKIIRQNPTTN